MEKTEHYNELRKKFFSSKYDIEKIFDFLREIELSGYSESLMDLILIDSLTNFQLVTKDLSDIIKNNIND